MSIDIYLVDRTGRFTDWYVGQSPTPVQFKDRLRHREQAPSASILVPSDGQLPRCLTNGLVIEVTELWQLETILQVPLGWQVVVFVPSALAALDNLRRSRWILVAARELRQDEVLNRDMVKVAFGVTGISADQLDDLLGRVLCYDVSAEDPLAFGLLDTLEADRTRVCDDTAT